MMASDPNTALTSPPANASASSPKASAVPANTHTSFIDYLWKDFLLSLLASLASTAATWLLLNPFKQLKHWAGPISIAVGATVGFFTSFGGWGKSEQKRMGIQNMQSYYDAAPPAALRTQLEQNEDHQKRMQRIQKIIDAGPPSASHQQVLTGTSSDTQQIAR